MNRYNERLSTLCSIGPTVRALLKGCCSGLADGAGPAAVLSAMDLERLPPQISGILALEAAAADYAGVPAGAIPRLRGIVKYAHTLYAGMTAGLCALGQLCNNASLPVLLPDSTAIRFGYSIPLRQHTWTAELSVPAEHYAHFLSLAREAGCCVTATRFGATIKRQNTEAVLIRKNTSAKAFLWEGAEPVRIGGTDFLRPEKNRLLVSLLEDGFLLLRSANPGSRLVSWTLDMHAASSGADWKTVAALAAGRGSARQLRVMLEVYQTLSLQPLGEDVLSFFPSRQETESLVQLLEASRTALERKHRIRRHWYIARLESADNSAAKALPLFCRGILRTLWLRLTPVR
ncbi:MAG: hypothetical protein E7443_03950 [Ruminococcaceae bacterium]|nr:hypothetical protein [Oscillospiraceae bacterium]